VSPSRLPDAGVPAAKLAGDAFGPTSASTITIEDAAGTTQAATVQLADALGPLAARRLIRVYLADDETGTPTAAPLGAGAVTVTVGSLLVELPPGSDPYDYAIVTDANGVAELTFDNAGGAGPYTDRLVLVLPDGALVISDALAVPEA
jgi:hypothetical protein